MPQVGDRLRILVTHDHIHLGPTLKASATCRINCCTSPGATRDLGQVPGFLENPRGGTIVASVRDVFVDFGTLAGS